MNPAEVVALNCFRSLGILEEESRQPNSVVSLVCSLGPGRAVEQTERFFFEDTCFVAMLIVEAEYRFEYIQSIIRISNKDGLPESPDLKDIASSIYSMIYPISVLRIQTAGLEQRIDSNQIMEEIMRRIDEYSLLMQNSLESTYDIPKREWDVPGAVREHPFEIYIGRVADNIQVSLGLEDEAMATLINMSVGIRWQTHMKFASSGEFSQLVDNARGRTTSDNDSARTESTRPTKTNSSTSNPVKVIWHSVLLGLSALMIVGFYPYKLLTKGFEWGYLSSSTVFFLLGVYAYFKLSKRLQPDGEK